MTRISFGGDLTGVGRKTVETKCGEISGILTRSRDGREFHQWRGIPFGKPPVGPLRFASPQPFGKWEGVRDGSKYGNRCPELGLFNRVVGNEDCLYLHVYAPKLEDKRDGQSLLPVMFYIHGGAFQTGYASQYRPDFFMDEDVILVTPNYRLGVFGFLSTGDGVVRGNMGLKDQVLALKWVRDNIEAFGGDPEQLTIFGESAGGACIHYLMLSPSTEGLFSRAISQSGVATQPWAYDTTEEAVVFTRKFAAELNCGNPSNSQEVADCLRGKTVRQLLLAYKKEINILAYPQEDLHWCRPCVENVNDDDAFLTERPVDIMRQGGARNVPWLTGVNADEGLFSTMTFHNDPSFVKAFEDNWQVSCCRAFGIPPNAPDAEEISEKIRDLYFPPELREQMSPEEKVRQFTQLYSDGFFNLHMSYAISVQRQFASVFAYYYSRAGGPSLTAFLEPLMRRRSLWLNVGSLLANSFCVQILGKKARDYGVCHADEIAMLFIQEPLFNVKKDDNSSDYKFSKDMVKLWVDFASGAKLSFRGVRIHPQGPSGHLLYIELKETPHVIHEPFRGRTDVLKTLNIVERR